MIGRPQVGVLALRGAFVEHENALRAVGVDACQVRVADKLDGLDGLVIPGGESHPFYPDPAGDCLDEYSARGLGAHASSRTQGSGSHRRRAR